MTYIRITQDFIDLTKFSQISELLVELDARGTPKREIGLNTEGVIVHMFPNAKFKYGERGVLDLSQFDLSLIDNDDLSSDFFNSNWLRQ